MNRMKFNDLNENSLKKEKIRPIHLDIGQKVQKTLIGTRLIESRLKRLNPDIILDLNRLLITVLNLANNEFRFLPKCEVRTKDKSCPNMLLNPRLSVQMRLDATFSLVASGSSGRNSLKPMSK